MFVFRKIWRAMFSCNTRFEICPFALLRQYYLSFHLAQIHWSECSGKITFLIKFSPFFLIVDDLVTVIFGKFYDLWLTFFSFHIHINGFFSIKKFYLLCFTSRREKFSSICIATFEEKHFHINAHIPTALFLHRRIKSKDSYRKSFFYYSVWFYLTIANLLNINDLDKISWNYL